MPYHFQLLTGFLERNSMRVLFCFSDSPAYSGLFLWINNKSFYTNKFVIY